MFQKMNELGQGMKDIATLLGTVIKLWNSKPSGSPHPRLPRGMSCIPSCSRGGGHAGRASSRGGPYAPTAVILAFTLQQKGSTMTPTPPPSGSIWHKAITGSSRINWRPGAGWQRCLWRGSCVRHQARSAQGPHVAWLSPVVHSARGTEVRAVAGPWRRGRGHEWRRLDG